MFTTLRSSVAAFNAQHDLDKSNLSPSPGERTDVVVDDLPERAARAGLTTDVIRESIEGNSAGATLFTGSRRLPAETKDIFFNLLRRPGNFMVAS